MAPPGAPALNVDWLNEAALILPVPLALIANLGLRAEWARMVTYFAAGALAAGAALLGLWDWVLGLRDPSLAESVGAPGAPVLVLCGLAALTSLAPEIRRRVARVLPIDPASPVHLLAIVMALVLFGLQVQSTLSGALGQAASSASAISTVDLVLSEVPFLLAAFAGVGLVVRRSPAAALSRLGYTRPAWWHLAVAVAAAGVFFAFAIGMDALGQLLTPGTARQVSSATNRIFGQLTVDPAGVASLAITAGICEEALFRGALQPRLGIIFSAIVFASLHTQYGISFDALAVLVLALGLGLIRRHLNTTSATVCHVAYDALAGFGLTAPLLGWAVAAELGLVAAVLLRFALARRQPPLKLPV